MWPSSATTIYSMCLISVTVLWVLYFELEITPYQSNIIIHREVFVIFVVMTTIFGILSLLSIILIKNMDYFVKSPLWTWRSICIVFIFIISLVSTLGGQIFLCLNTNLGPYQFRVSNETAPINAQRLGSSPSYERYRIFTTCDDDRFLGCLINKDNSNNEVYAYIDEKPSSPLPDFVIRKSFILITKGSDDEQLLRKIQITGKYRVGMLFIMHVYRVGLKI